MQALTRDVVTMLSTSGASVIWSLKSRVSKFDICIVGHHPQRANKRTIAGRIAGVVLIGDGDRIRWNVWKGRRTANVGGERISHKLVALRVLHGPGVLIGDVESPRESHVST